MRKPAQHECGQCRVLGLHLRAIKKLKAPQLGTTLAFSVELNKRLLHERVGIVAVVAVGCVIGPAQAELPLRCGVHSIVWQA